METPNVEEITTVITHGTTELMQVKSLWAKEHTSYGQEFETGQYSKDEWVLVNFDLYDMDFHDIIIDVESKLYEDIFHIVTDDFESNYLNA